MVAVERALWFIGISHMLKAAGTRARQTCATSEPETQVKSLAVQSDQKTASHNSDRYLEGERFATAVKGRSKREAPLTPYRTLRTAANYFRRQT